MTQIAFDTTQENIHVRPDNPVSERPGYRWIRFVGWIPDEWPVQTIGSVTKKVGSGITPRGGEKAYVDEGIPIIRSQNVLRGRLDLEGVAFITEEQHSKMESTKLQSGDVLLNITGASIGRSCVTPEWLEEGNVNQHVCILRPKNNLLPKYLSDLLNSRIGRHQIYSFQTGGSREGLNYAQIRAFQVPVPPLKEQKRIASTLRTWDRHLTQIDALIEQKQTRLKGLRQRLLTGDVRFPAFTGSNAMEEVDIGYVPRDWNQCRLGDLFDWRTDKNHDDAISKVITVGKDSIRDQKDHFNTSVASDDLSNYRVIEPGDFVYDPMSAYYGALGRYDLDVPGVVSPAYRVIQLRDGYDSDFVRFLLDSHYVGFRIDASSLQNNKSGKRRGLRKEAFASIKVYIPPTLAEQRKIANVLEEAEREIDQLRDLRAARARQKKGLMQRLLTGEVRV